MYDKQNVFAFTKVQMFGILNEFLKISYQNVRFALQNEE